MAFFIDILLFKNTTVVSVFVSDFPKACIPAFIISIVIILFKPIFSLLLPVKYFTSLTHSTEITNSNDSLYTPVFNDIRNLCIATGTDINKFHVFITKGNTTINSFTFGTLHKNKLGSYTGYAGLGITEGLLYKCTPSERFSILAYSFIHLLNENAFFNSFSISLVSFLIHSIHGSIDFAKDSRNDPNNDGSGIIMSYMISAALVTYNYIFYCIAKLLQHLFLNRGQYLSDAGAVGITNKPASLYNAIRKIYQYYYTLPNGTNKSSLAYTHLGSALTPLYFVNPFPNTTNSNTFYYHLIKRMKFISKL